MNGLGSQPVYSRQSQALKVLAVVAGLIAVAIVLWSIVEAVRAEPAIAGSIIGSLAAAAAAVLAVVFQQAQADRARLREIHRKRMEPLYEQFIDLAAKRFADAASSSETNEFFQELRRKQLLLGANLEVIQAFNAWNRTQPTDTEPLAPALAYETLLHAIRTDLGHDDSQATRGDLLRLFSDFEDDQQHSSNVG